MKKHLPTLSLILALLTPVSAAEPANPAIDYPRFLQLTQSLAPVREKHRISEAAFIKMAAEPGTIILDARSRDKYTALHIKGAQHLAFTDFTSEALAALIPSQSTRILIYCNNNFENEPVNLARKNAPVSLNIQTFINLHAYGYKNVYELGPLLDMHTTVIPFTRKLSP